jgi:hypothetical protein
MFEPKTEKTSWIQKIKLWWRFEGRHIPRDIQQGLWNLWRWRRVIWKDRNWDSGYIFNILQFKLELTAEHLEQYSYHVDFERDVQRIKTCIRLIQKHQEEYYTMEYQDYCEARFCFKDLPDQPGYCELKIDDISDNFQDYFAKYPRIHRELLAGKLTAYFGLNDDKCIAMNIAQHNHRRAKQLLFKILHHHIDEWWN